MLEEISFDESPKLFQSTTDRLCYWSKGAVTNRNPKALGDNDYERVFPENRYKDFDPIPERFQKTEVEINEDIDKFLGDYTRGHLILKSRLARRRFFQKMNGQI